MAAPQVHKFGGSSLADPHCFEKVCELVQANTHGGDMVVVSAAGKTTNTLLACMESQDANEQHSLLQTLLQFQHNLIEQLLPAQAGQPLQQALAMDVANLQLWLTQPLTHERQAEFVIHGEIWSARLLAALLSNRGSKAQWLDARTIFVAGDGPQPAISVDQSRLKLAPIQQQHADVRLIVTGFIARNQQGQSVTLGRNGSDYSASMLAVLANAKSVTIWTDVAGVYSADPRKVSGAHTLPLLSLQEADELARLGSPVLHARTLQPLLGTHIRAAVRSTFAAHGNATQMISGQAGDKGAKTVTYLDRVSVISITSDKSHSMSELHQTVSALFNKHQLMPLAAHVSDDQFCLRYCFTEEIASAAFELLADVSQVGHLTLNDQHCLLALVGAGVRDNARHYHSFYRRLDHAPVEFIETGPDGVSLVAVMRQTELDDLVAQLHQAIASPDKRMGIVLFGAGKVGQAWLNLYANEQTHLANHHNLDVVLAGVVGESRALIDFAGLPEQAFDSYQQSAADYDMTELSQLLASHPYDELVVIDATDSEAFGLQYPRLFESGCHVVSANKKPAAASLSVYREITQHQQERARHWLFGATISACLPITESIDALHNAGDQVDHVEGIFSGTWSWLLAHYDGKGSFTDLVQQAMALGLTEPDPRLDLSGEDVVHKLLILARRLDLDVEPEQVQRQSVLPAGWEAMSLDACWDEAELLDQHMAELYQQAAAKQHVLSYQASLDRNGTICAGLTSIPRDHAFANLPAAVTAAAISSKWYAEAPMVLQAPGAGLQLAAGAIQMDLFRLCRLLRQV
ncbi:bifunctional aspartate kinase/homoserine dehydrogenase II [Neiella marina]|uniref:Bifunctional aspartokinase/homoserine dehydrogenase n=1 Tax=Neiella holothuriorum TaxID=2870530 RepID=A0ABS7ECH5_9GAMM|nr:bifunctional aspartate kinase/homoserine dehydrogenase II [Neiella holothuriorum]MBW8190038.1 bifunctional aspartate kinase/homoserine dehydrogenase II [Neiella holothuriorum]